MSLHKQDIVVVAVHLFEHMPDIEPEQAKYIRWKQFSDMVVEGLTLINWPIIYQLDYVDQSWYLKNSQINHENLLFGNRFPNSNLVVKSKDFVTTSNQETKQLINKLDPAIVMLCGLHKDYCVKGVLLDIHTQRREYFISEGLSFTRLETAKVVDDV